MAVSTASRPPPPQLTWIERSQAYRTPPVASLQGWVASSDRGLIRIRLQLEDGPLLELPLPRASIESIVRGLQGVLDQGDDPARAP
jgi:hypothetical protein